MRDIEFTIIMPVYNSEKYLEESIKSILNQTYQSFELLLIDDGSTDCSGEICDKFAKEYHNIIVYHKENGGICSARNYGMERVRGEYVYFMDNDDILRNNALEIMNQALQGDVDSDILTFGSCLTNIEKGKITSTIDRVMEDFVCNIKAELRKKLPFLLENGMLLCVWDKVYKAEFLIHSGVRFNSFFTHGGEDLDFNLQLIKQVPRLKNIEEVLYEYYIRDVQSTYRKFNANVYAHAIRNLKTIQDISKMFELNNQGYIYTKYVEYRLRFLFMLGHAQANLKENEKIKILKKELDNDGYKNSFKIKALLFYIIHAKKSFKMKFLVATNFLHLYRMNIGMIKVFKRK